MAFGNPLGQHLTGAAAGLNTNRVKTGSNKEIIQFRRFPQQVTVIRRKAFRTVEKKLDTRRFQNRNAVQGLFHDRLEMIPVLGQGIEGKILGDTVHSPGLGNRFESTNQQLAGLFPGIDIACRIAENRQIMGHLLHGLGDDVEMFGGMQRHGNPRHAAHFMAPQSGAIDDILTSDVALIGADAGNPALILVDGGDFGLLEKLNAAHLGSLGQGLGGVDRIGDAVLGDENGTDQIVGPHQGPQLGGFFDGDDFHIQVETTGHGGGPFQLLKTFLIAGHGERSDLTKARRLTGFRFQPGIKVRRVLGQPCHVVGGAQLADQAGGMPGSAAGQ